MSTENENPKEKYADWKSPENSDNPEKEKSGKIHSYLEAISPEELQKQVIEKLAANEDELEKKIVYRELGLTDNSTPEDIAKAIENRIEQYQEKVADLEKFIPEHTKKVNQWLEENGLTPQQKPESVPVHINDYVLLSAVKDKFPEAFGNVFDSEKNIISVTPQYDNNILAHEYFHAMSHDAENRTTGFNRHPTVNREGNLWLDEGATMIGEFATYPTKVERRRDQVDEMYDDGYWWLTQLYLQELGVSENEFMKAYFGEEPFRTQLEEKTQQRFGCSITDLDDIFMGYAEEAKERTLKIIKGEAVILEAMEGSGLEDRYYKLAKIFPHVKVVIVPQPRFEQ